MALQLPDFSSESEEADWWYDHRDEVSDYMAQSVEDGTAMNAKQFREMLLRDHDLILPDAIVRVPLSKEDVACAKTIAESSGLSVEEYISNIVHKALIAKPGATAEHSAMVESAA